MFEMKRDANYWQQMIHAHRVMNVFTECAVECGANMMVHDEVTYPGTIEEQFAAAAATQKLFAERMEALQK